MKRALATLSTLLAGGLLMAVFAYVVAVERQLDLQPWHTLKMESEFRAKLDPGDWSIDDYIDLENTLFDELDEAKRSALLETAPLGRYNPESPTNPSNFKLNWNRTIVHQMLEPRGLAILIHGLSDSPYSMRSLAEIFARNGFRVISLRVPGHGTIPQALTTSRLEDWRVAVRIACREVSNLSEEQTFIIGGYSNGAALALDYALDALDDPSLRRPDRLVFLSPALAVSKLAALAKVQLLASRLPFFSKLGWNSVLPEYDPYKYNSFALNAAWQIFRLTSSVDRKLARIAEQDRINDLPPVLAIQSAVDATVPPVSSLSRLFGRLQGGDDELVLFDLNRVSRAEMFLQVAAVSLLDNLKTAKPFLFDLTVIGNLDEESAGLVARRWPAGEEAPLVIDIGLSWPPGIYSLSHVAIPFPPDDPIYGVGTSQPEPFPFGNIEARGERGVLTVPVDLLMRLRYNPFFAYLEERVTEFAVPGGEEVELD